MGESSVSAKSRAERSYVGGYFFFISVGGSRLQSLQNFYA